MRERGEGDQQPFPPVMMAIPGGAPHCAIAQAANRVAFCVKFTRCRRRSRLMQQVSVLRRKEEYQPIDEAQKLPKEIRQRQRPVVQTLAQGSVRWVRQEAVAESTQRSFDAIPESVACRHALALAGITPALQGAIRWWSAGCAEAADVNEEPQDGEIRKGIALSNMRRRSTST